MQTITTTKNDPVALAAVVALLGLALFANIAHIGPPKAEAQNIIILQATATPALPTPALAPVMGDLIQPTPMPAPQATDDPVALDPPPPVAVEQLLAPTPDIGALIATLQARDEAATAAAIQTAIDQAAALNDPQQNGGNTAPQGCPFPIINGRCANGVLAKSVDAPMFGSKSIAESAGPAHQTKGAP